MLGEGKLSGALRAMIESTAKVTGQDLFDQMVSTLAKWLDADIMIIGQIVDDNIVDVLSMYKEGEIVHDHTYSLKNTPCEDAAHQKSCIHQKDVCKHYPADEMLRNLKAEGYIGVPLKNQDEKTIGILSAMFRRELGFSQQAIDILIIMAERIAAEIDREKAIKLLEKSEEQYRTIFESSKDAIMLLVPKKKFISANQASLEIFGCNNEQEFIARSPADFSPEYQQDGELSAIKAEKMMQEAVDQGSCYFEWTHQRLNGEQFPATVLLTRMSIDGQTILQATVRDITIEKQAEEALKEVTKMKERFTSIASHELKSPLVVLTNSLEFFLNGTLGEITPLQREWLERIRDSVARLNRIASDVLDFQKLEIGKMDYDLQPCDINDLLQEVYSTMLLSAEKAGLSLVLSLSEDLPQVNVDKDKIIQVLINLINNGIKVTQEGGLTVLSERCEEGIRVTVEDTGPGIKEADIPRLFIPFEQIVHETSTEGMGTGLGLSICRELIEGHGGKIWAETELGQGSSFHFLLPVIP